MTAQLDSTPPAYPSITAAVRAITPYRVVVMMAAPARRMELSTGIAWRGSWPQHRLAACWLLYYLVGCGWEGCAGCCKSQYPLHDGVGIVHDDGRDALA